MSSKHQEIFNRLCAIQQSDLNRLKKYSQAQLSWQENPESWSIIQVLNHLYISQKATFNFLEKQIEENPKPKSKTGIREWLASFLLNRFLKSTKKAKAPKRLPEPKNDTPFDVVFSKYADLQKMGKSLESAYPKTWSGKQIFKHPRAGWLGLNQTHEFLLNHWKHHQHQIENLENQIQHVKE